MIDQYGDEVPTLFLIGHLYGDMYPIEDSIISHIVDADWYEVAINQDDGEEEPAWYLMANAEQIEPIEEFDCYGNYTYRNGKISKDIGGTVVEILKVNDVLKRWDEEDGFRVA